MRSAERGMGRVSWIGLAAFLLLPLWAGRLDPNAYAGGRSQSEGARAERNSSAVARLLGEFRTAASDIMFIKTERYLDSGIAYEPHITRAQLSTVGAIEEVEEHAERAQEEPGEHAEEAGDDGEHEQDHHHHGEDGGTPTIIPAAAQDYRGFIGWLQRNIKPWRDPSLPHEHTDGLELLPWFRLMTVSDPHYVRGYAIGGWWLTHRNLDEGLRFAEEGLRNNPDSFEIGYTYGNLLLEKARLANAHVLLPARSEALPLFLRARDAYRAAAEAALRQRPPGWVSDANQPSAWTDYREEDARGAARMAALCERNYGDPREAVRLAVAYVRVLGPDDPLDRLIQSGNPSAVDFLPSEPDSR